VTPEKTILATPSPSPEPKQCKENPLEQYTLIPELISFEQGRYVEECLNYIKWADPTLGDVDLLSKLPNYKHSMFKAIFHAMDKDENKMITQDEIEAILKTVNKKKPESDKEKHRDLTYEEFLTVAADCEVHFLFEGTFLAVTDDKESGAVKAGDINRILGRFNDVNGNDRMNIIDMKDEDALIDFEQFSKIFLEKKKTNDAIKEMSNGIIE